MNIKDLEQLPAPVGVDVEALSAKVQASGRVLVVLDDDPTGTQSVSDLPVLSAWGQEDLSWALSQGRGAVYVLTNSRSLEPAEAARVNREVARNAIAASRNTGVPIAFVSRSDSTLRGHFPLETDVLTEELVAAGRPRPDGVLMVPAFPDAGRITVDSVHYYVTGDQLTPVAETEFAQDATFGYSHSDLRDYVEEKTGGSVRASEVVALTLEVIRRGSQAVEELLAGVSDAAPVVVDVVLEDDMRVVALALESLEAKGKTFLYRVGPPFVRARIGQKEREPLSGKEVFANLEPSNNGGLVVVGSHVGLTTRQLDTLVERQETLARHEIDVTQVLDGRRDAHLSAVVDTVTADLAKGTVVVNTSRLLTKGSDADDSLRIAREVSAAVVEVVQRVLAAAPPRFVIAKGGITSSDVATKGLQIGRAMVRGPMLPGIVSLWEPVDGPAKGIPYVVFAGNVGSDDSLAVVVDKLSR